MKRLMSVAMLLAFLLPSVAQEMYELKTSEAKNLYKTASSKRRVSVHDPSVVFDHTSNRYYIFGSHQAWAWTSDLQNWTWLNSTKWSPNNIYTAFSTNKTTTVKVGGVTKTFGNFDAQAWAGAYGGDYNIGGNLWAPDVIWNEQLGKWCQYLSVNGPSFASVIIMLTASNIEGPYTYQGPVVYSGFGNTGVAALSWKNTDVPLVLGDAVTTLPSRYNISMGDWAWQWLNCIDPCVFYDQDGKLWMVYGSWFGGLWMLELDEATGLRDYDVQYGSDYASKGRNVTRDPYYGIKVHGGHWVSGEGPYIEYIRGYYYLFASYGGLSSNEGYQMRVFRSEKPEGPYVDSQSTPAIYSGGASNYGVNPDTRGEKLLGPYDKWGFQTAGELAQGHNSIIAAPDGRTYLVYHTRFNTGGEGHEVRVHQVFQNQNGWLVAAPFEYNGETVTDEDIATTQVFTKEDIVGTYQILIHKYSIDHANYEVVTPVKIRLNETGTVTGSYSGTWSLVPGTSYFNITLGGVPYKGVLIDEQMDGMTIRTVSFSAAALNGVNVWGYKYQNKYGLAWQLNNQSIPVSNNMTVSGHLDMERLKTDDENIQITWTSSAPDIIAPDGTFNPTGLTQDTVVDMTLNITCGNYYWENVYKLNVNAESMPEGDFMSGLAAYYNFDSTPLTNVVSGQSEGTFLRRGTVVSRPKLEAVPVRTGRVVHIYSGANRAESYVRFKNPLYQSTIDDGFTVAFWTKPTARELEGSLFSFYDTEKNDRLWLTGNSNIFYGNSDGDTLDINNPALNKTTWITANAWSFVVLTVSRTDGIHYYTNGITRNITKFTAVLDGEPVSRIRNYDYNLLVDLVQSSEYFYFGYDNVNGSPEAYYDDLFLYGRELSSTDARALYTMANRVYDFSTVVTGVQELPVEVARANDDTRVYDLQGRVVGTSLSDMPRGIYIYRGRKYMIR